MTSSKFLSYAERLISRPTAPFREQWVAQELDLILSEIPGLEIDTDRFGNRIARLTRGNPAGPLPIFVAHLDHPGFLLAPDGAQSSGVGNLYHATFEGRVMSEFFHGTRVRLYRNSHDPGVVGMVRTAGEESVSTDNRGIILETEENADGAVLAMWDLTPFEVREGMLHARVCDDLAGVAAILAAFEMLSHGTEPIDVAAIFSRAEEAGFCGVLCLLSEEQLHPLLSEEGIFISVENSSERAGVACGDGAIIRLGDRASTFDGPTADLLWRVAKAYNIKAKRMLMDGGTCEATVFARKGLRAGGLCIPLRNYHNMDRNTGRIAPEAINLGDAEALATLIATFTVNHHNPAQLGPDLDYDLFLRKGLAQLKHPSESPLVPAAPTNR
jgi:putative aminopeptidase FrvX